jgi:hypothetical protein
VYNRLLRVDKQRDDTGIEVPPADRKFRLPTADGKGLEVPRAVRQRLDGAGRGDESGLVGLGFTCYVPGRALSHFRPFHAAIPAGYDVSWTIHHTPNGTELTDRPEVRLTVTDTEPEHLLIESFGGTDPSKFAIPPNEATMPRRQRRPPSS